MAPVPTCVAPSLGCFALACFPQLDREGLFVYIDLDSWRRELPLLLHARELQRQRQAVPLPTAEDGAVQEGQGAAAAAEEDEVAAAAEEELQNQDQGRADEAGTVEEDQPGGEMVLEPELYCPSATTQQMGHGLEPRTLQYVAPPTEQGALPLQVRSRAAARSRCRRVARSGRRRPGLAWALGVHPSVCPTGLPDGSVLALCQPLPPLARACAMSRPQAH